MINRILFYTFFKILTENVSHYRHEKCGSAYFFPILSFLSVVKLIIFIP